MDENDIITNRGSLERTAPVLMPELTSADPEYNDELPPCEDVRQVDAQLAEAATLCPNCGAAMSVGADYCEACRHYVNYGACSFCGAELQSDEAYCPECGSSRGGIVCPRCNTMNDFAFCRQCGLPLTDEARFLLQRVRNTPEYRQVQTLANQFTDLEKIVPMTSDDEIRQEEANRALRNRVLKLLAEDRGEALADIPQLSSKRLTKKEYEERKHTLAEQLVEALELMQTKPMKKPVEARNYAMAMKPAGLRLAWRCNYKNAIHSSPCGCAKPQLGGKWIILGQTSKPKIVDDNG